MNACNQKGIQARALLPVPRLRGKTISVGVRVTPKLRADAMSKARLNGDAMTTANTWAGLVRKWALDYVGHPERYTWVK